jgi:transcriptional regulator with XRE-family HTH domain
MRPVSVDPSKRSSLSGESNVREIQMKFGRRILRLRQAKGWSRLELARRIGVSRERLGYWERGEHAPSLAGLAALGKELGVPIDELVIGERGAMPKGFSRERRLALLSYLTAATKLVVE